MGLAFVIRVGVCHVRMRLTALRRFDFVMAIRVFGAGECEPCSGVVLGRLARTLRFQESGLDLAGWWVSLPLRAEQNGQLTLCENESMGGSR